MRKITSITIIVVLSIVTFAFTTYAGNSKNNKNNENGNAYAYAYGHKQKKQKKHRNIKTVECDCKYTDATVAAMIQTAVKNALDEAEADRLEAENAKVEASMTMLEAEKEASIEFVMEARKFAMSNVSTDAASNAGYTEIYIDWYMLNSELANIINNQDTGTKTVVVKITDNKTGEEVTATAQVETVDLIKTGRDRYLSGVWVK